MVFEEDISKKIKSNSMQLSAFLLDWFDQNKRELHFEKIKVYIVFGFQR